MLCIHASITCILNIVQIFLTVPAKPFRSDSTRSEWFKYKELGFLMIWSQGTLSVVFSPVNNCFSGKKERVFFHRIVTCDEKWIHYSNRKRRKSWGLLGHASTSSGRRNIYAAKVMLFIWWDEVGVIYYELLKPNESVTEEQ